MTPLETIGWWALTLTGLAGSALFSGFETGSYTVNRLRLAARASADPPDPAAARLRREIDRPERLLATLLTGNNVANYMGSLGIAALLTGAGLRDWAVVVVNALLLTPALLILGEILPKEVFRSMADRLVPALTPVIVLVRWAGTAVLIVPLVLWFGRLAAAALGGDAEAALRGHRQRIADLLQEGVRHGDLSERQGGLLERAMNLRRLSVADEMIPWRRVVAADENWTGAEAIDAQRARPYERLPVVDRRGRVVGQVRTLDLFLDPSARVRNAMRPPLRLTPETPARDALKTMREQRRQMAVVERDGKPVGLVTLKDLVEPLTGELGAF